jgi:hypothetical protein
MKILDTLTLTENDLRRALSLYHTYTYEPVRDANLGMCKNLEYFGILVSCLAKLLDTYADATRTLRY